MITKSRLDMIMASLLGSYDAVQEWWTTPNTSFAMRRPIDLWEGDTADQQKVSSYIVSQKIGDPYSYKCN